MRPFSHLPHALRLQQLPRAPAPRYWRTGGFQARRGPRRCARGRRRRFCAFRSTRHAHAAVFRHMGLVVWGGREPGGGRAAEKAGPECYREGRSKESCGGGAPRPQAQAEARGRTPGRGSEGRGAAGASGPLQGRGQAAQGGRARAWRGVFAGGRHMGDQEASIG
ncbi:MAG: hypothetical protein J3K34DRAFT_10744 [Monoraphidium minutum]|nr:MAG: hypothetical protein J3K34DRAFT_10744 [Monoraphidium minutum]